MEDNNRKLYPLRFVDEGADVPWGHVSYQIADLGFKDSMIDNGWFGGNTLSELMGTYLERVVGDDVFEFYGPVSYKHLRAHETPEQLVCRLLLEKKKDEK